MRQQRKKAREKGENDGRKIEIILKRWKEIETGRGMERSKIKVKKA
jgi:hypothetical protein